MSWIAPKRAIAVKKLGDQGAMIVAYERGLAPVLTGRIS